MKSDKKILKEMQELDQVMNKRLAIEKKLHEGTVVQVTTPKRAKRTEYSF
ncbi:MAG: hypothetical protein ABJF04_06230 [Reichenbachiella sp.]